MEFKPYVLHTPVLHQLICIFGYFFFDQIKSSNQFIKCHEVLMWESKKTKKRVFTVKKRISEKPSTKRKQISWMKDKQVNQFTQSAEYWIHTSDREPTMCSVLCGVSKMSDVLHVCVLYHWDFDSVRASSRTEAKIWPANGCDKDGNLFCCVRIAKLAEIRHSFEFIASARITHTNARDRMYLCTILYISSFI